MEKKNMRQILLCLAVSYCFAHAMEQEKKLHPLLALPSDLKVEILCRLFSKNDVPFLKRSEMGKEVRSFLLVVTIILMMYCKKSSLKGLLIFIRPYQHLFGLIYPVLKAKKI